MRRWETGRARATADRGPAARTRSFPSLFAPEFWISSFARFGRGDAQTAQAAASQPAPAPQLPGLNAVTRRPAGGGGQLDGMPPTSPRAQISRVAKSGGRLEGTTALIGWMCCALCRSTTFCVFGILCRYGHVGFNSGSIRFLCLFPGVWSYRLQLTAGDQCLCATAS